MFGFKVLLFVLLGLNACLVDAAPIPTGGKNLDAKYADYGVICMENCGRVGVLRTKLDQNWGAGAGIGGAAGVTGGLGPGGCVGGVGNLLGGLGFGLGLTGGGFARSSFRMNSGIAGCS